MKTLSQYLAESAKFNEFRLKTIVELSDDQLDKLETHLRKYEAYDVSTPQKTIFQKAPLDFPECGACEVFIIDFKTKLQTPIHVLKNELIARLKIGETQIRIRNKQEPLELIGDDINQEPKTKYKPRLTDDKYSEHKDVKGSDYHGDKHLSKFLKDLSKKRVNLDNEYKVKNK